MKFLLSIIKWIFILIIFLLATATYMAEVYSQTAVLVLILILLFPLTGHLITKKFPGNKIYKFVRVIFIIILLIFFFALSITHKKDSIYRSLELKTEVQKLYNEKLAKWPVKYEISFIDTKFGKVHIIACGPDSAPPILLFHASAMGGVSWAENVENISKHYRIYAIDNPGEAGKSELKDVNIFPDTGEELSKVYAEIADNLKIKSAVVIAASNGGFIALNYAYYYPERVKGLILLGPMGIVPLSNKNIFLMTMVSMYPLKPVRDYTVNWTIGSNQIVNEKYRDWFDLVMISTFPSIVKPQPVTSEQKKSLKIPVLLILGNNDNLVGDADLAKNSASEIPNIKTEILYSGHLIGVEQAEYVNNRISEYLKENYPYE